MNDKHNIDRLFREKFKDFEVTPPEFVWENIEEALLEKKKRRVIPLWIKLTGVAAVLVIGSVFTVPYLNSIDTNDNPVVIEKEGTKRISPTDNPIPNNGKIIVDSTKTKGYQNTAVASGEGADRKEGTAAEGKTNGNVPVNKSRNNINHTDNPSNDAVAHSGNENNNGTGRNPDIRNKKNNKRIINRYTSPAVAQNTVEKNNTVKNPSGTNPGSNTTQGLPVEPGSENAVAAGREKNTGQQDALKDPSSPNKAGDGKGIIKKDLPIEEAVAQVAIDTATIPVEENPLEKMLQDKLKDKQDSENAVAENSDKGKWNIKPQVAPVFYSSLSQGSPIDGQFANNSKSFDNDLSYGVGIDYAVTDRLSIRSGINTLNLSYATNDVQFSPSLSGHTNNVSARAKTANIVVTTEQNPTGNIPGNANGFTAMSINEQSFNGSMIQSTGYIEVPVEMSYALVNRKFGIDVIGGVSTLFLNENNVSVVSTQGYSTEVGEAQNLNSVHFSTNIGVGFKYRFWKSFQANFEPTFKYQVNAYSRDAGNFKPYFIGLYSGISFSF